MYPVTEVIHTHARNHEQLVVFRALQCLLARHELGEAPRIPQLDLCPGVHMAAARTN
jgi:hypothetical protein